jgi:hypothetical protein
MQVEVTGQIGKGRCEVRTEWCLSRACGVVGTVLGPGGTQIRVCGACLEEMADTGAWHIPGTRPVPWPVRSARDTPTPYTPNADALVVAPMAVICRGRCEVQTDLCEARDDGVLTSVITPDCHDVNLCGACLEKMAVTGAWDLGWSGGHAVAAIRRHTEYQAAHAA